MVLHGEKTRKHQKFGIVLAPEKMLFLVNFVFLAKF
jgi:hypothetical protein